MSREGQPQPSEHAPQIGEVMNGRQTLVVPNRFELSWDVGIVDRLGSPEQRQFQLGLIHVASHMGRETSSVEAERLAAMAERGADLGIAVANVLNVSGVSIAYPDRNTRYTNMDGRQIMPEAIDPYKPIEPLSPLGGIANPLNHPDLR